MPISRLASRFAIEVCDYAIISNHFHLVLHVDAEAVESWAFDEVLNRWIMLHKGSAVGHKYKAGKTLTGLSRAV